MTKPLTAKGIEKLKKPGRYHDGHGLYLTITPRWVNEAGRTNGGVRSWIFRYEHCGKAREMGLGPLHTVTLKKARELARAARLQLLDGIDPIDARKKIKTAAALAAAKAITFQEAANTYYRQHAPKWSAKHAAQFIGSLRNDAFPKIGRLSVADIDTGQVLRVLEPIWHEKTETASRVRNRIEKVLGWAKVRGYRSGDNPAQWRDHLAEALPSRQELQETKHHPALPYVELPGFMVDLAKREGIPARALEFTILTAARTGEVRGATWDEIDLATKVWTVPAARMKAGREHRVPLSEPALKLLAALPREEDNSYLFIGQRKGRSISDMAMHELLKRMRSEVTVHGFRSTFMDWAHDRTAYPKTVFDMALAHAVGDKVEAAYRRGDLFDKRRKLMTEWARYCSMPVTVKGTVTPIRKGA